MSDSTENIEHPLRTQLLGTALWRRLHTVSLDHFRFQKVPDGYVLDGRVLTVFSERPAEVHYAVFCGSDLVTRHAIVTLVQDATTHELELKRTDGGQWLRDGVEIPELAGLPDVDLSITPATNTPPIRRTALEIGESAAVDATWVRFPEMLVERLPQRYVRTDSHSYRYESGGGAFTADVEVDDAGLVVRYGDLWERVSPPSET